MICLSPTMDWYPHSFSGAIAIFPLIRIMRWALLARITHLETYMIQISIGEPESVQFIVGVYGYSTVNFQIYALVESGGENAKQPGTVQLTICILIPSAMQ